MHYDAQLARGSRRRNVDPHPLAAAAHLEHARVVFVPSPLESERLPDCSAALSHHWLVRRRGGERVLEAIAELLPATPIYTLLHRRTALGDSPLARAELYGSWLQAIPWSFRLYPWLLQFMPGAARGMHLPDVDLVVCSDAAVAKCMTPAAKTRVVCYCHTPMRYVYEPEIRETYARTLPPPARPYWRRVVAAVREQDRRGAARVDLFVANSRHVAERIRRAYGAEAIVVHPPVDIPEAIDAPPREDFYLAVGHHVAYKRLDLAVDACRRMGRRLVVIGDGPGAGRGARAASPQVDWLGWRPAEVLASYYRRARALLFPGEEDFGIVPVEAVAHGCPVVAYGVGGAAETVVDGVSGVLFPEQSVDALVDAMQRCERTSFDPDVMRVHARRFSKDEFLRRMTAVLRSVLRAGPRGAGA